MAAADYTDLPNPKLRDAAWVTRELFGGTCSVATVQYHTRAGRIPALKLGRRWVYDEHTLRAWARAGGMEGLRG